MDPTVLIMGGLALALGAAAVAFARRRGDPFVVLARRGGQWEEGGRAISLAVDDACVCLDRIELPGPATRARCAYVMLGGPVFTARRDPGQASRERFGAPFAVAGSPAAWTPLARELSRWLSSDTVIRSDGRELTAVIPGVLDENQVQVVVDLLAELARHGQDGLASLLDAGDGAVWQPPSGRWNQRTAPAVALATPASVQVGPARAAGDVMTCARAPCPRATPSFAVSVDPSGDATGDVEAARALFPATHAHALSTIAPCAVSCDGVEVRVTWPGVETDPERLLAAARFVGAFAAAPGGGVFR